MSSRRISSRDDPASETLTILWVLISNAIDSGLLQITRGDRDYGDYGDTG